MSSSDTGDPCDLLEWMRANHLAIIKKQLVMDGQSNKNKDAPKDKHQHEAELIKRNEKLKKKINKKFTIRLS